MILFFFYFFFCSSSPSRAVGRRRAGSEGAGRQPPAPGGVGERPGAHPARGKASSPSVRPSVRRERGKRGSIDRQTSKPPALGPRPPKSALIPVTDVCRLAGGSKLKGGFVTTPCRSASPFTDGRPERNSQESAGGRARPRRGFVSVRRRAAVWQPARWGARFFQEARPQSVGEGRGIAPLELLTTPRFLLNRTRTPQAVGTPAGHRGLALSSSRRGSERFGRKGRKIRRSRPWASCLRAELRQRPNARPADRARGQIRLRTAAAGLEPHERTGGRAR